MPVTDEQLEVLRMLFLSQFDEFERASVAVADVAFSALLAGAFVEAVVRRFGRTRLKSEIIRYVAMVRARQESDRLDIDPLTAERLIRAALGEVSAVSGMSEELKGNTQAALLIELVEDEKFDRTGLDAFLAGAKIRAERIDA